MPSVKLPDYYMKMMASYVRTTAAEDAQLIRRHRQGDTKATKILVANCLGLVIKWAVKYGNLADPEELIGSGHVAIMVALTKFKLTKKVKFATYAEHWIKAYVLRDAMSEGSVVSMSADTYAGRNLSLNEPIRTEDHQSRDDEDDNEYIDMLVSKQPMQDDVAIKLDLARAVNDTLGRLNNDHRGVLKLRFMSDDQITLEMVGHKKMLGRKVNRERVRQIQIDAIERFKLIHKHNHADYAEAT